MSLAATSAPPEDAEALSPADLDGLEWTDASRRFVAHGHDFGVRTTIAPLGGLVDELFAPFATAGRPGTWYSVVDRGDDVERRWELYHDAERLRASKRPDAIIGTLTWHVNRSAIDSAPGVTLHAAAAARRGNAVILPAPMESGKTTTVAGLLRAGLDYLSDEAVSIDPESLSLHAYPKALSVDEGSWEVLADLNPNLAAELEPFAARQWQVPAERIGSGTIVWRARPVVIITPRYRRNGVTELAPVRRSEMVRTLAENTFRFHEQGRRNLGVLGALVRGCACYRLEVSDLDHAVALILEALGSHAGGGA